MKKAIIFKNKTGWWAIECCNTGDRVGGLYDTETEAICSANDKGYLVDKIIGGSNVKR